MCVSEIMRILPQRLHSMRRDQLGNVANGLSMAYAPVGRAGAVGLQRPHVWYPRSGKTAICAEVSGPVRTLRLRHRLRRRMEHPFACNVVLADCSGNRCASIATAFRFLGGRPQLGKQQLTHVAHRGVGKGQRLNDLR